MGVMHATSNRLEHANRRPWICDEFGNPVRQTAAFGQLHREELLAIVLADLVDGQDVRMVEVGGRLGFLAKTQHVGSRKRVARRGSS